MKFNRKLAAVLLTLLLTVSMSGCTLVNVNADKDNAQVIATMDGQNILKSEYNNYMALTEISYKANSTSMPTGSNLTSLKQQVYDSLLQQKALYLEAKKEKLTADEASAKSTADSQIKSDKSTLGDDAFAKILTDNNTTEEAFTSWYQNFQVESAYATAALQD